MAEEQDEKLEFTPEGETLGYISLDQAQVLARQTAREAPGTYGSSYDGVPMAFDVVESEETEDHYVITLSFRPQGEFSGRPGREQFFIAKEGNVADRQVVALPKEPAAGHRRSHGNRVGCSWRGGNHRLVGCGRTGSRRR